MKRIVSFLMTAVMLLTMLCGLSFESSAAKSTHKITKKNPAVVIRSSFATCGYSDNWGGVHTAVPEKDKEGYILYDVIIWEDRINLYKFPNDVEHNEKEGFDFSCDVSTPSGLKKYVEWRESFCLKSVPCKDTENMSKSSETLRDAFVEFFRVVDKKTPSKNIVLKYSGHGNIGYSGCMNVEDTKIMLEKGVKIFGQKFALIDFGTNCQSGNTDYVQVYHNYTDYLLLSQFDFGGYGWDEWDYEIYKKVDIDYCYGDMFKVGSTVEQAGKSIVNKSTERWKYCKKDLRKKKLKQSMTLLDMSAYDDFMPEFAKLLYKNPESHGSDVYALIKKKGSKKLQNLYKKFVIYYKDNNSKEILVWDKKSYGLTARTLIYKLELSETQYTYNGKARKPSVKVALTNGAVLTSGKNGGYTVSYAKGRKNVGKYKVTVSLKGNYGSKEELFFTVKPQKVSVTGISAIKKGFKLKWKPVSGAVTGYQVQYGLKSSLSGADTKTVKKADSSGVSVKKLKSKKKYYVRIRAYKTVDGKKLYSAWSAKKTVKTK
ncbi:MAG: fibronectin type III domain-containing protein [Clostridia bacterium]|nr:fibronectin type III domain-containing protein [Clostridia bacterium]